MFSGISGIAFHKSSLFFICRFLSVRQETGDDAQEWQEGTHLKYKFDACPICQPAEESGAKTTQAKHQSEEDSGY